MYSSVLAVRPGVKYRDVGNVIQKHAQANGCSVVRSYCGHGINQWVGSRSRSVGDNLPLSVPRLFHTVPNVPHYSSKWTCWSDSPDVSCLFILCTENKAIGVMKPGHSFTIEPMINQGTVIARARASRERGREPVMMSMYVGTWRDVTWPDNWTSTTTVSWCVCHNVCVWRIECVSGWQEICTVWAYSDSNRHWLWDLDRKTGPWRTASLSNSILVVIKYIMYTN